MKYTVVWTNQSLDDLGKLWLDASDRSLVTRAADEIDRRLSRDPETQGEQRIGVVRLLIVEPLAVAFTVRPLDLLATVFMVYRAHR